MEKINIRNLYIDLLNKIRNVEGVDKDYVDGLVDLIDQHLTTLDRDFNALASVIPESASVTNPLVTENDLPAAQVNSDWASNSGVSEILNKPYIYSPLVVRSEKAPSNWVSGTTYYTCDISFGANIIDSSTPPIVWAINFTEGEEPTATNKANFNLIVGAEWYYDETNSRYYCRLFARSGSVPTGNIQMAVLGYRRT